MTKRRAEQSGLSGLGGVARRDRDTLGLWIEQTDGAKFWMKVFTDLKARGCQDLLIAVTDGLKGMSEALAAVFPTTTLQTCIVQLMRNSLAYATWKELKVGTACGTRGSPPDPESHAAAVSPCPRRIASRRRHHRIPTVKGWLCSLCYSIGIHAASWAGPTRRTLDTDESSRVHGSGTNMRE